MTARYTTRSATYIGSLTLTAKIAERLAAFVQIAIIASIFGADTHSDLYFIASIIPLALGTIVGEGLATSVLPTLVRRQGAADLSSYLATTFWVVLGVLVATWLGYLALAFAVVKRAAPAGSTDFLPWLAFSPTIVTLGLASYFTALLLFRERYTWPPFRSAVAAIAGLIFVATALAFTRDIAWIALATSAGYAVSLALLMADTRRSLDFDFGHRPTRRDLRAVAELRSNVTFSTVGGVIGGQSFVLLERALAASLGVGAVSTISYARGIVFTPTVAGQAIAMGLYPGMVRAHEAKDTRFVRDAFFRGLRLALLASGVTVLFVPFFGRDLVQALLQRGALSSQDVAHVTHALIAFTPAVLGSMLLMVSSRALYAIDYFRGILFSQLTVVVFYVPIALAMRGPWGATGLALAFGIAELFGGLAGVLLVVQRTGASSTEFGRLLAAAGPLAVVVAVLTAARLLLDRAAISGGTGAFARSIIGGVLAIGAVVGFVLIGHWPEADVIRRRIGAAFGRPHRRPRRRVSG